MVDKKESSGLWKSYVIGALVVALLVVLFYSPGVLLSPSEPMTCEEALAAAQADVDAAQTELDVKEGELTNINDRFMDRFNAVQELNARIGELNSQMSDIDVQIADIDAQIRSLVGTDTDISDLVAQRGALSDQRAGLQNDKRSVDRALVLDLNVLLDLAAQVRTAQDARDVAQVDLNYAIDTLANMPTCPGEPCYTPDADTSTP
ncbi:MAG: hypothetical protein AABX35_01405 [Nanoarchaeota archaeon]